MKYKKRILTFLLLISLIINLIPLNVKADGVGSGWNAVSGIVVPTSFGDFTVANGYNYISTFGGETLPSGINFYFSYAEGKCYNITFDKVCTSVLNAKIGLTMSETILTGWLSAVLNYASNFGMNILNSPAWAVPCPLKPCVTYNSANDTYSLVGFALTPLDGCVYSIPPSGTDPTIDIPSNFSDWVKEFTDNYIDDEGLNAPDYINIGTITENIAKNYVSDNTSSYSETLALINNPPYLYMFGYGYYKYGTSSSYIKGGFYGSGYSSGSNKFGYLDSYDDIVFYNSNDFNTIVTNFGLSDTNNTIPIQDLLTYSGSSFTFSLDMINVNTSEQPKCKSYNVLTGSSDGGSTYYKLNAITITGYQKAVVFSNNGFITVYKNYTVPRDIDNNVYSRPFYISNNYVNYSSSNDNSLNTKVSTINNSVSNNTNIFNSSKTETNTNITNNNYQIDNSTNDNSVTTIINNYYGSSGGDDDDDDDDDDDIIWDRLLNAIADFFSKIGDIVVAILAGIVELFGKVLEGIASIVTDFTGITDFFTQVFSFLPSDLVAVLSLALTTALLISLIRMFRK